MEKNTSSVGSDTALDKADNTCIFMSCAKSVQRLGASSNQSVKHVIAGTMRFCTK